MGQTHSLWQLARNTSSGGGHTTQESKEAEALLTESERKKKKKNDERNFEVLAVFARGAGQELENPTQLEEFVAQLPEVCWQEPGIHHQMVATQHRIRRKCWCKAKKGLLIGSGVATEACA